MFDDLDDPNPPVVPYGARDAVVARGSRLRRRRGVAWGAGGTSLALVLVATAVLSRHEPVARIVTEPTVTPSETPSPVATASPSASPSPSPTETEQPTPPLTLTPSWPSPSASRDAWGQPDGRPGWSTGYESCANATSVPSPGGAPFPDLTITVELPATASRARDVDGTATIHNAGDGTYRFALHDEPVLVASDGDGHLSGTVSDDVVFVRDVVVGPHQDVTLKVSLPTFSCADTFDEEPPRLPPGKYTVGLTLHWGGAQQDVSPSPTGGAEPTESPSPSWSPESPSAGSGEWGAVRTTVTLT